jgi:iron complex outermembrane receptor protein
MRCTIIHASDDEGSPIMLNPITVTAESKNSFQTGDVDTQEVSSFYSIIKKEDIDGKMTDLADILKKEASIQIQRSTGLGSYSTMSIRGSSADQVIVYMDGILLNNASGGGVDLSNISISEIESIEIYRGTTPINFSQSSIGGVVNIKTNRIKKGSSCSIKTGYGDYHTLNFNSFINHKPGKWDCIFSYDHFASDNNYEISLGDNTDNPFDDRVEDRKSDDFYQNSYLFKMGYDFSEQFRVEFLNNHFSKTKFIPDAFNRETNSKYKTDQNSSTVKITTDNNQSLFMSINLSVSLGDDRYDDPSDKVGSTYGLGKQQMAYHTYDYNFNYFSEWLFTKHILRLTLDARKEKYNQVNEIDNTEAKCYRKTYSVGFQNTFFLLNQKLHIMPALRLEFVKDMNDQSLFRSKDKMVFNDIQKQNYFVPQLGIKYQLFESCSLKSNIGKYFRQPSFFERYSDRGHFQGNPTLEAEEGVNFDVGIEVDYYCQFEWLERFSFDAAYYESDISNFIAKEYDSSGTGRYTNLANGKIDGIETMINIDFLYLFNFNFNAVWQDPINLDEKLKNLYEGDNTYKNLPGSVEKSYLTRLETRFKGFKTYLEYIRQSGLFYDSPNNLPKSKNGALKKELNAGISYSYQSLLLTIDFNNINNNQYDNISYYGKHPNPGRTVFYSLKYEF